MARIEYSVSGPIIRGMGPADHIQYEVDELQVAVSGTTAPQTHQDVVYDEITSAATKHNHAIRPTNIPLDQVIAAESEDESIATIGDNFIITHVADGVASVILDAGPYGAQRIRRYVKETGGSLGYNVTGFDTGTAGATVLTEMLALISGETAGAVGQEYIQSSNWDLDNPSMVLNPNFFAGGLDFSPVSVMRAGRSDDAFPIALVTSDHALSAKHTKPAAGTRFAFRRPDGTFQTVETGGTSDIVGDLSVVHLAESVTGITPLEVLPASELSTNFAGIDTAFSPLSMLGLSAIPTLRKSRHLPDGSGGSAVVFSFPRLYTNDYIYNSYADIIDGVASQFAGWYAAEAIGGDSSGPNFMVRGGQLVLLGMQYSTVSFSYISGHISEINTAMDTLAGDAPGTWTLTEWAA